MKSALILREQISGEFFTGTDLTRLVPNAQTRHNLTSNLIKKGYVERIKNGLYVFSGPLRKKTVSVFHLANMILSPSYVSLESALSHYGLIPETVFGVTSVNTRRTTEFKNQQGSFYYKKIPKQAFPLGITRTGNDPVFLMAEPEKALCDKIYLSYFGNDTLAFLLESLRIEEDDLLELIPEKLAAYAPYYNKSFSNRMVKLVKKFWRNS